MSLYEIDRMVAILMPSQTFLEWVNSHAQTDVEKISLDVLLEDCTALLIPPFETIDEANDYIHLRYLEIFENELEGWFIDKSAWPPQRTLALFTQWFKIQYHSLTYDMAYPEEDPQTEKRGTLQ